jgi:hypothetical protein
VAPAHGVLAAEDRDAVLPRQGEQPQAHEASEQFIKSVPIQADGVAEFPACHPCRSCAGDQRHNFVGLRHDAVEPLLAADPGCEGAVVHAISIEAGSFSGEQPTG